MTVVERAPALREDGAGLTLWPNAMRALDTLGVGAAVRDIGEPVVRAVIRRQSGAQLTEMPIATLTSHYGPLLAVHRGELHRTLADEIPNSVRYGVPVTVAGGQVLVAGEPPQSTLPCHSSSGHPAPSRPGARSGSVT